MYSLSLPLCHAYRCCEFLIRLLKFHLITILTRFVILFCVLETVPFFCVVGLVFHFFVVPFSLFAVFESASAFNQDVSKWNTGAVTTMSQSKCTLSPSLWPCLPLWYILNVRQLEFHRGSQFSHVLLLIYFWLCVVVGYALFLFCAPLL